MSLITSVTQRFSPVSKAQRSLTSEPPQAVSLLQSGCSIPTPECCFWECHVSMVTVLNSLSAAGEHSVRDDGKLQCSFNGNIKPAQDAQLSFLRSLPPSPSVPPCKAVQKQEQAPCLEVPLIVQSSMENLNVCLSEQRQTKCP